MIGLESLNSNQILLCGLMSPYDQVFTSKIDLTHSASDIAFSLRVCGDCGFASRFFLVLSIDAQFLYLCWHCCVCSGVVIAWFLCFFHTS